MSQRAARLVAVSALALTGVVFAPAQANAVGGNCSSALEKKAVSFQPDVYRVRAWCSSLQADSRAQGVLDRTASLDAQTQWFTGLNINYYSDYKIGPIAGTYTKISHL
jgi:hypothetical protein